MRVFTIQYSILSLNTNYLKAKLLLMCAAVIKLLHTALTWLKVQDRLLMIENADTSKVRSIDELNCK